MIRKLMLAAALAVPAVVLSAAAPQDDLADRIANNPLPAALQVYGLQSPPKVRADEAVQFGKALRVAIPNGGGNAWSVGANSPLVKPVKKGDKLILAFWARLEKGEEGATATKVNAQIQLSAAPYTQLFGASVDVGTGWKMHEVRGAADKDYDTGAIGAALHLAGKKQTIDLGPVFVLNMGQ